MNEQQLFEVIRKSDEVGWEYWFVCNFGFLFDYKEWWNFYKVIVKVIILCEVSGYFLVDYFVEINKMVELGFGVSRNFEDFYFLCYVCYLVV